jgi:C-8 sterol isomerase
VDERGWGWYAPDPLGNRRVKRGEFVGYIFDPDVLHEVAKRAVDEGGSLRDKVSRIRTELSVLYPDHIRHEDEWVFNIAGGALGQMTILHASLTEYILVFGSPVGTQGYSGRFFAEYYIVILEGEHWTFAAGDIDRRVHRPGERTVLWRGEAKAYRMPDRCYGLEYARGFIPSMLPFGLADSFSSTLDPIVVWNTMRIYTRAVVGELLRGKI